MRPLLSFTPQWKIPGIGIIYPSYDQLIIVSRASPGRLNLKLPLPKLKSTAHRFKINTYRGRRPRLCSTLLLTCASGDATPLALLQTYERELCRYSVVKAELAFDAPAKSEHAAVKSLLRLVHILGKRRHLRQHMRCEYEPDKAT